jgi:polyisoprenyl-phosphate glycosyltransferase
MKLITIVTKTFNEEENVVEVYHVIKNLFEEFKDKYDYEHIFIDNKSTDQTVPILKGIADKDKHIKIIVNSRNFIYTSGMSAFELAKGDALVIYDANLKDPPELIKTFIEEWEKGFKIVYGVRKKTADKFPMQYMRKLYYRMIRSLSGEDIPLDAGGFRIIDRVIIDQLKTVDDYYPELRGYMALLGFNQKGIDYSRNPRKRGKSKSNLNYLIDLTINSVIIYSTLPIRLATYLGLLLSFLSFTGGIIYIFLKLFIWKAEIPAVAGVIFLLLFFNGIVLLFLGIIGEYVGAIHSQVRKKPSAIIEEKINFED